MDIEDDLVAPSRILPGAIDQKLDDIAMLATLGPGMSVENARTLIRLLSDVFAQSMLIAGFTPKSIRALRTKFRDSGRRSAPWRPASSRVPGRPQDGADGNRINRWLMDSAHKFYADEATATLVEVKYYLQTLSMMNAPVLSSTAIRDVFYWLIEHPVEAGTYADPIQLLPIDLMPVAEQPRLVQSGHLIPLDRDGRHVPGNTFLMLARSNQLQGNLTVDELLALMADILVRHRERGYPPS